VKDPRCQVMVGRCQSEQILDDQSFRTKDAAKIAGEPFDGTIAQRAIRFSQRHRESAGAECDELEDPRWIHTIGNASRLASKTSRQSFAIASGSRINRGCLAASRQSVTWTSFKQLLPLGLRKANY